MENRLCLNKKPVYELPDEVIVGEYSYSKDIKRYKEPDFEPDICIANFGSSIGVDTKKRCCQQIWVKSNNKELITFLNNVNWKNRSKTYTTPKIELWQFKKIILEEFYGVKYGE